MWVSSLRPSDIGKCYEFSDGKVRQLTDVYEDDSEDFYHYTFINSYGAVDKSWPFKINKEVDCEGREAKSVTSSKN